MRRKKRSAPAQPRADQARPQISFRVARPLLARMDEVAEHLKTTRSELFEGVLTKYLVERGDQTIVDLLQQEANRAKPEIDLFA